LPGETEIIQELNAAWPEQARVNTQLENLAQSSEETPDTGAETWVLILWTFLITSAIHIWRRRKNANK
jgi:hypothetical protein